MSVVYIQFNEKINLALMARRTINAHYKKKRFAACIVRSNQGVGMFYSSGKLIMNFKHISQTNSLLDLYSNMAKQIHPNLEIVSLKTITMTVSCKINGKILLGKLIREERKNYPISHNFELFPGLTITLKKTLTTSIKIVVFMSGAFNITGSKSIEDIREALNIAEELLPRYLAGF